MSRSSSYPFLRFVLLTVAAVALATHGVATALDRRARDGRVDVPERLQAATMAAALEPFDRDSAATRAIVLAERHLAADAPHAAYRALEPFAGRGEFDADFRYVYRRASRERMAEDARKAHQQHAREDEEGGLATEDVLR